MHESTPVGRDVSIGQNLLSIFAQAIQSAKHLAELDPTTHIMARANAR